MSTDTIDRKRSVDVRALSAEQVDLLSEQIGKKVTSAVDETIEKVNKLLGIYGLEAKMQIVIYEKGQEPT